MKYFIYKTTHKNGKYYIGRHSTNNIDDGYIGSGVWPRSIKNKKDLSREILEFANSEHELLILERKHLNEHFGKPGCMNRTPDPVGWNSENNPMKDPRIVENFTGDNHWTRKTPEKLELISGKNHWMNKDVKAKERFIKNHPNNNGDNAKKAIQNGTHINLTNNPSKTRSDNGTHQWFKKEDGTSIGGETNKKRINDGTHNWLGGTENKRRIKDGTHNFLGSASNLKMLQNGKHPSQKKIICEHCGKTVSSGMFKRWHGDNCKKKI